MFFIAYAFKGQVHVLAGHVNIVNYNTIHHSKNTFEMANTTKYTPI